MARTCLRVCEDCQKLVEVKRIKIGRTAIRECQVMRDANKDHCQMCRGTGNVCMPFSLRKEDNG
jgi:hypothetical protein